MQDKATSVNATPGATPAAPPSTNKPTKPEPTTQPGSKKPRAVKIWIIAAIAAFVVLGGSAAAYFGVVVPNQPENKLKKAVQNLSEQQITTVKGSVDIVSAGMSANVGVNMLHVDPDKNVALADMAVTVSGVKLPMEMRYVDNTAYIKLGDLSTIKSLLAAYGGAEAAPLVDLVDTKVSNQWIEIDRTFLNQMTQGFTQGLEENNSCSAAETTTKLRTSINDMLQLATTDEANIYTITNTTEEDVDGQSATKMQLSIDDSKVSEFGKKVADLQSVKDLEKCFEGTENKDVQEAADSGKITTFNVWVDGNKQIKRVEVAMETAEVSGDEKTTTKLDMTMVKDAPAVEKPSGAKPVMQLIGELQSLFGGSDIPLDSLSESLTL